MKENGKTIYVHEKLGIAKGMYVIVLQQAVEAVEWLVQVGYNQIFKKDMLNNIKVKLIKSL